MYNTWIDKRQAEWVRKKFVALKTFLTTEIQMFKVRGGVRMDANHFLVGYTDGELTIFEEMLAKLIIAKNSEIFS